MQRTPATWAWDEVEMAAGTKELLQAWDLKASLARRLDRVVG